MASARFLWNLEGLTDREPHGFRFLPRGQGLVHRRAAQLGQYIVLGNAGGVRLAELPAHLFPEHREPHGARVPAAQAGTVQDTSDAPKPAEPRTPQPQDTSPDAPRPPLRSGEPGPAFQGRFVTFTVSSCSELKSVTSRTWPFGSRAICRGNPPAGRYPASAGWCAMAEATFTTARLDFAPAWPNRLESATTTRCPASTSASPTGASPTSTRAISACARSSRSREAEKPSSTSLSRAVTHTVPPLLDVITRTGLQPAVTVDTIAWAGSVSALCTLITASVPWPPPKLRLSCPWCEARCTSLRDRSSLVEYSQSPSGDTASPTGAIPAGTSPTKPEVRKWLASACCRLNTAIRSESSRLTKANLPSREVATSIAPPPPPLSVPRTAFPLPCSAAGTLTTVAPLPFAASR